MINRIIDTLTQGGTRGYLNTDPMMQSIFVAWVYGHASGNAIEKISSLDVLPTIAAILGIEMKAARGHVLQSILKQDGHR